ncbi:MAG: hypothetical protein AAGJ28_07445 [Pseudomonadota bacterium]
MAISAAARQHFAQLLVGAATEASGAALIPGMGEAATSAVSGALSFVFGGREDQAQQLIRKLSTDIGQNWEAWSATSSHMTPQKLASVQTSFNDVVPRLWLTPREIAERIENTDDIADLLLNRVAELAASYKTGMGGENDAAREFLRTIISQAYQHLCRDPGFFRLLDPWVQTLQVEHQRRQAEEQARQGQNIEEMAETLRALAEQQGRMEEARAVGVNEATIIELARRVTESVETVDQALIELDGAIEIAIEVKQDATHPSNLSDFVDQVIAKLAEQTATGQLDEASATADAAFAQWERDEAERQDRAKAEGRRLLQAGVRQDLLRRDAKAAAEKIARQV